MFELVERVNDEMVVYIVAILAFISDLKFPFRVEVIYEFLRLKLHFLPFNFCCLTRKAESSKRNLKYISLKHEYTMCMYISVTENSLGLTWKTLKHITHIYFVEATFSSFFLLYPGAIPFDV